MTMKQTNKGLTMRQLFLSIILLATALCATAQEQTLGLKPKTTPFSRLDASVTAGSPGLGVDLATPLWGDFLQLRAGFSAMPNVNFDMHCTVQAGSEYTSEEVRNAKFARLAGYLEQFTGYKVDNDVVMVKQASYYNGKLLLDIYPLRNKHWRLTAGVYYGSSDVARAFNRTEEMPSLVAVGIYNKFYDMIGNSEVLTNDDYFFDYSVAEIMSKIEYLRMLGFNVDADDPTLSSFYLDEETTGKQIKDAFQRIQGHGRMGIRIGKYSHDITDADGNVVHKKGEPYMMEPDEYDSMVKAWVKVNKLKPYLGIGYGGQLSKREPWWKVSVDLGLMFWGGTPHVPTHDGTDLIRDVEDVIGYVGDNIRLIEKFKAFPVVDFRLTRTFNLKRRRDNITEKTILYASSPVNVYAVDMMPTMAVGRTEPMRRDVFFDLGSSQVKPSEEYKVGELAEYLRRYTEATLTLTGFADMQSDGQAIDQQLSELRAAAIADRLVNHYGIDARRIERSGKGGNDVPFAQEDANRVCICVAM